MEVLGEFNRKRIERGPAAARGRHRHPHRPARRRLRRQLEGALVHGHRRHGEHQRAPLRHRRAGPDHRQRGDARPPRQPLRVRGASARASEGQREAVQDVRDPAHAPGAASSRGARVHVYVDVHDVRVAQSAPASTGCGGVLASMTPASTEPQRIGLPPLSDCTQPAPTTPRSNPHVPS